MPSRYPFEFVGQCLGDWIADGAILLADPDEAISAFDLVFVALRGDVGGPWAEFMNTRGLGFAGVTKIYLGNRETDEGRVHIVGQLFPPCASPIPESAILAMHRVAGSVGVNTDISELTQSAFDLLSLLADEGATAEPINPRWQEAA